MQNTPKDTARKNADKHFTARAPDGDPLKQEASLARAASDANTSRLRTLRLEKEEADRQAANAAMKDPLLPPKPDAT
jgi:hypothetical protein